RNRRVVTGEDVPRRVADEDQIDAGRVEDLRRQIVVGRQACDRLAARLHLLKATGRDLARGVDAHRRSSDSGDMQSGTRPPAVGRSASFVHRMRCVSSLARLTAPPWVTLIRRLPPMVPPAAADRTAGSEAAAGRGILPPPPAPRGPLVWHYCKRWRERDPPEKAARSHPETPLFGGVMSKNFAARLVVAAAGGTVPFAALAQATSGPDDRALVNAAESGDEWLTYGRDYAETRFSPLDQIDERSVSRLGLAWTYETGSVRGHEATPLVMDGVLYATTSWSNVFALDARTGEEVWFWDAKADRARGSRACCDVVNRGVALYDGKVYVGVIDGRLAALDAATGEPVW